MTNNRIESVGINIAEKATVIWNIADILRGPIGEMLFAERKRVFTDAELR